MTAMIFVVLALILLVLIQMLRVVYVAAVTNRKGVAIAREVLAELAAIKRLLRNPPDPDGVNARRRRPRSPR